MPNHRTPSLGGLSINYLIELLKVCKRPIRFNKLFEASPIKLKKGFLKYLNYCVEQDFIERTVINYKHTEYYITVNGRELLRMLQ